MCDAHLRGHYNTHIANATRFSILAKVTDNDQDIKFVEKEFKAGGKGKGLELNFSFRNKVEYYQRILTETHGFAVIKPNNVEVWPSSNPHVSVFYKKQDGFGEMFYNSKKMAADASIIVTETEGIKIAKEGKVWVDIKGKNYKR